MLYESVASIGILNDFFYIIIEEVCIS